VKVACWQDERFGPALVVVIQVGRRDSGPPETASIPQAPPGPMRQYMAKGSDLTWGQWVQHLSGHLPYGGWWSVEEVPDGRTAHQALAILRQQAMMHGLDSSKG
jgi:hypothetical protein